MLNLSLQDKIGNLLRYLATEIEELYLTKALKILYIIDENAVRKVGVPVSWQAYEVWKLGPVAKVIYEELDPRKVHSGSFSNQSSRLSDYVSVQVVPNPVEPQYDSFILKPVGAFSDDEFTDFELELMQAVVSACRSLSSKQLVEKLHKEGTLWHQKVQSKKLKRVFALQQNRSSHIIDFTELLKDDPIKAAAYKAAFEAMVFRNELDYLVAHG